VKLEAREKGYCSGLLYFLRFFISCRLLVWVVVCLVLIVDCVCRLYSSGLSLFVGCRLLSADSVDCLVLLSVIVFGCQVLVVDCLCRLSLSFFLCRCPALITAR
jgi:hypothetical protein